MYRRGGFLDYLLSDLIVEPRVQVVIRLGARLHCDSRTSTHDATVPRSHTEVMQAVESARRIEVGRDTPEDHALGYIAPDYGLDTEALIRAARKVKCEPGVYIARLAGPHMPPMGDPQKSYLQAIRAKPNLPEREATHLAILFRHAVGDPDNLRAWEVLRLFIQLCDHRWLTDRLAIAHLKMVPPRVFRDDWDGRDELISAGNEGLMLSIGGYDPRMGFEFSTYAGKGIITKIRDADREMRSAVHRPSEYWKDDNEAVFDVSLDCDFGGGKSLHESFSPYDVMVSRSLNRWSEQDWDHLERMQPWLDALWARPQRYPYLDTAARLFIRECRDVYAVGARKRGPGFELLCRSRRHPKCYRDWTLWTLDPGHYRTQRMFTFEYQALYMERLYPARVFARQIIIPLFIWARPDIQAFLKLDGRVDKEANKRAWFEGYWPRLNAAEGAAKDGMTGFFAGGGSDAHDAAGYTGDLGKAISGPVGRKQTKVKEHQLEDIWERASPPKEWKVRLGPRKVWTVERIPKLIEFSEDDPASVRKAYKDKRPSKEWRKRGVMSLPVVHGGFGDVYPAPLFGVVARNSYGATVLSNFGRFYSSRSGPHINSKGNPLEPLRIWHDRILPDLPDDDPPSWGSYPFWIMTEHGWRRWRPKKRWIKPTIEET